MLTGSIPPTYSNTHRYVCHCWHCGQQFSAKYPLAKWCSYRCCNDAYVERRRERRRIARQKTCAECGVDFEASRKDAKYCTLKCKQKAYRKRTVTEVGCGKSLSSVRLRPFTSQQGYSVREAPMRAG